MLRTLCLLVFGAGVFACSVARADDSQGSKTYAALCGAVSNLDAEVCCADGGSYACDAALDGFDYNLDDIAGIHGSVTYRVQIDADSGETRNLVGYDLCFSQLLTSNISLTVELGTGGSFNHPLDDFNSFYQPDHALTKARLKQAFLHIN